MSRKTVIPAVRKRIEPTPSFGNASVSRKKVIQAAIKTSMSLVLAVGLLAAASGCTLTQAGANDTSALRSTASNDQSNDQSSTSSGNSSGSSAEGQGATNGAADGRYEQQMQASGTSSSGASRDALEGSPSRRSTFRDTSQGEPVAIHQFVNEVLADDEYVKITLQAKTADELGDAGFTLVIENRYLPLTSVGYDNYCYLTPFLGTWTVNGVPMEPKVEGEVFPGASGTVYLYFDEINSIEQLVEVKGKIELYYISDWWNPVRVYEFEQS